uniref:Uncharacterized protein n=2 Tax=Cannabis sativa TaxID=3483 RepID=A0A803PI08_CANSA
MESSTSHNSHGGFINESDTMSPDIPMASSSCIEQDDDKDDSWMQFITDDDSWCQSNTTTTTTIGAHDDVSRHISFTN